MSDIQPRVIAILSDILDIKEECISVDQHIIDDLEADSLDFVEILMFVEEEFDVDFGFDFDEYQLTTVQSLIDHVDKLQRG